MKVKDLIDVISRYASSDEEIIITTTDSRGNSIHFDIGGIAVNTKAGDLIRPVELYIGERIQEGSTTSE